MIFIIGNLNLKDKFDPHKIYCVSNKFDLAEECLKIYANDKESIERIFVHQRNIPDYGKKLVRSLGADYTKFNLHFRNEVERAI